MSQQNKSKASQGSAPLTSHAKKIEVVFALERAGAREVFLCGDFNGWSEWNLPMIRRGDCQWEKKVTLPPGCYEYKFVIDGTWTPDPGAAREVANSLGSSNSVVQVG